MLSTTCAVTLFADQSRSAAPNVVTRHMPAFTTWAPMREMFLTTYPTFSPRCRAVEEPAIAVVAVDE